MKDETKDYKVFTDATFPNYLFINQGGDVFVAKKQTKFLSKQRGIYHFSLKDRDGKIRAVSESRVCVAMKLQRGLEEVVYIPKHKTFRKKKDSVLVELIKAKQKLQEEYPNIDIDDYADEAYLKILKGKQMPTEYENLREVLLQNILAVKIERAKRSVPFNEAKYMIDDEDFLNE